MVLSCKKSDNQSIKSWEVISENVQYSEQNDKVLVKSDFQVLSIKYVD